MVLEQQHFERLCVISDEYRTLGIEKVSELLKEGQGLIKFHGEENLDNILQTEDEFRAAGVYFDYKVVTNEELSD